MDNKFSYKENKTNFIRVKKDSNYTTINNTSLRDDRLSWKAKGIMAYILTLPDDWIINLNELMNHSPEGEKSFRSGFNELKKFGYIERIQIRDKNKIIGWETIIYEKPETVDTTLLSGNVNVENVNVENVEVQKEVLLSTDYLPNTNNTNNNIPPTKSKAKYDESSPYYQMAQYMYQLIKSNNETIKEPNYQTWSDDFRKIVEIDKREKEQLGDVLRFSQENTFWRTNILSPAKLRKQYSTLYGQMKNDNVKPYKEKIFNPWEEDDFDNRQFERNLLNNSH